MKQLATSKKENGYYVVKAMVVENATRNERCY